MNNKKTILVLGASGMLGHKMFETLTKNENYEVYGTVTSKQSFNNALPASFSASIVEGVLANDITTVEKALDTVKPSVVINCIGLIKQKKDSTSQQQNILLNSLFPHQVNALCEKRGIRFITIATDCVFDGQKGSPYVEADLPTCHDAYGMSKYLGEVHEGPGLSLRTSIIGHELKAGVSLLDWFLSQNNKQTKGFTKAIFSGFPTVALAKLIGDKIIPDKSLNGLYHISVNPISKHDLLTIVKNVYGMNVDIIPSEEVVINRSLNSDLLREKIGYTPPSWKELIKEMHEDYLQSPFYKSRRAI